MKVVIQKQNLAVPANKMMIFAKQGKTVLARWNSQVEITNNEINLLAHIAGGYENITSKLQMTQDRIDTIIEPKQ